MVINGLINAINNKKASGVNDVENTCTKSAKLALSIMVSNLLIKNEDNLHSNNYRLLSLLSQIIKILKILLYKCLFVKTDLINYQCVVFNKIRQLLWLVAVSVIKY